MPSERSKFPAFAMAKLPPHPATVVQPKLSLPERSTLPPHPATVVQKKAVVAQPTQRPPHPATISSRQIESADRPASNALQCMKQPEEKPKYKDFVALLRSATGIEHGTLEFLIVSLTLARDETCDHATLYKDSVKEYKNRGTVLNPSQEITYAYDTYVVSGSIDRSLLKPKKKKPILVITSHGNLQWLFGEQPGREAKAALKFCTLFKKWLNEGAVKTDDDAPDLTISNVFSAIVLDACWSGSEPVLPYDDTPKNVDSPAKTLSKTITTIPVIGINGKTLQSIAVSYYSDAELNKAAKADYSSNALIFLNGVRTENTGEGKVHYHSTELLKNPYYRTWLGGDVVDAESYLTQ